MKFRKILNWTLSLTVLAAVAVPFDAEGVRRRQRTATPETTQETPASGEATTQQATQNAQGSSRRENGGTYKEARQEKSVTQKTIEAANKASGKSNAGQQSNKQSGKQTNNSRQKKEENILEKIKTHVPDLEQIREKTLNPNDPYHYAKLKDRYDNRMTYHRMTPEEFRYFYLGYMFQEDYDPYRESPYAEIVDSYRQQKSFTKEESDTIQKYALKALEDNPFDLRTMSFLVQVLKNRDKEPLAKFWEFKLERFLGVIKSTGTGEDIQNAWFVIYPVHEFDMVQLMGYDVEDVEYPQDGYDKLIAKSADGRKTKDFYFNMGVPQQQYSLKHPEEDE